MKIQARISGKFQRTKLTGTESQSVSLKEFITEIQAIATENRRRTPQLVRQSFGLNFLSESVLINLFKQAHGVNRESQLYQIKSLRLLAPTVSKLDADHVSTYSYTFSCDLGILELAPDDPQIPIWNPDVTEQEGYYLITLDKSHYPGLDSNILHVIWNYARQYWQNLPDIKKIHLALQSLNVNNFRVVVENKSGLVLLISLEDLSLELSTAILFLRGDGGDVTKLSEMVRSLVQEYQSRYRCHPIKLPELEVDINLPPQKWIFIQRSQHRSILQKIIQEAQKFLLISSYIIEDEHLTKLICQKALELPQGVWILTDFRDQVLDRLDEQVIDSFGRSQYQRSDDRKRDCLIQLIHTNVHIRSGAFHLKTYISEKHAYLGSCNLTGGSLDFNLEAGIVFRNNPAHESLVKLFRYFWEKHSQGEIIPDENYNLLFRGILSSDHISRDNNPKFLTPNQYKADLIRELRNFSGQVIIYTRSFQPQEIEAYLKPSNTRIFIDSQISCESNKFEIQRMRYLHGKITILENKLVYIGGVNFNFSTQALSLHDLMYKTTDMMEINLILEKLNSMRN
jgi:phosphatidylserine/phosphatidylglycerophosphate/cardiolipin synthase-like enzyme